MRTEKPMIMGILNCTPDSFYVGSRKQTEAEIASRAEAILLEGGDIIDLGAYSTRPGAAEVSVEEEMRRMRGALQVVRREHPDVQLSIDTFRPEVARMAIEEYGAQIINDISDGMYLDEMAALRVPYILMSQQPDLPSMLQSFREKVARLTAMGCPEVILDPGFGFGKEVIEGNYSILSNMHEIRDAFPELQLLVGVSRKRMIHHVLESKPEDPATMQGTMLLNLVALQQGATILRVHDVKETADVIKIAQCLRS